MPDRSSTTRVLVAVSAVVTALLLGACGGGSQAADAGAAATPAASGEASGATSGSGSGRPDFQAFLSCMSEHGVTMPEGGTRPSGMPTGVPPSGVSPSDGPGGGGFGLQGGLPDGVDQATFDAAQQACASLMPQGGFRGGAGVDQSALAAYKSCLTDHQVTIPAGDNWLRQLDRTDATVKAAIDTCAPLLPALAPRPSPTP